GCSSGHHTTRSGRVVVSTAGRIGPLRVDQSNRADVVSFAGRPDSETSGRYDAYSRFDALGYGCRGKSATGKDGVPNCDTVFYLDASTSRLALLYTEDKRYVYGRAAHAVAANSVVERQLCNRPF